MIVPTVWGHCGRRGAATGTNRICRAAFSLVELVVVVVIIGIVSAIAVPRFSQATDSARASYIEGSVASVRRAIELYFSEHGRYPGYDPSSGTPDDDDFVRQLVEFTDQVGKPNPTYAAPFVYGPYLRAPFPANPFNDLRTVTVKATPAAADPAFGASGWVAVLSSGDFGINAQKADLEKLDAKAVESGKMTLKGMGG